MDLIRTKKVFFQEQSVPVGNCPVGSQESRSQSENGTSLKGIFDPYPEGNEEEGLKRNKKERRQL